MENTMRKLIVTVIAALSLATAAHADNRHHRNNNNDWIIPLIGGMIIGNALNNQPRYVTPRPQYYQQPRYYQPAIVCQYVAVYDNWGNYLGQQKQCWEQ
jgi:hypothetical protein